MAQWRVQLQGHNADLVDLKEILEGNQPCIIQEDGIFYITSKAWDQLGEAGEVHNQAKDLIQLLDSAAHFHFRDTNPLTIGGVVRVDDDGRKHHTIIAETGIFLTRGGRARGKATALGPNNQPVEHQIVRVLRVAALHPVITDALKFFRKGDWVSLYKAYEIVGDEVGGKSGMIRRNWVTKKLIDRFTQTAQSRRALGDEARHASRKFNPPKNPMSLREARGIISDLVQKWIESL